MKRGKAIVDLLETPEAIVKLKSVVEELRELFICTRDKDIQEQLDTRILQLNMYIARLEGDLENGLKELDVHKFSQAMKDHFVMMRTVKTSMHNEREFKTMKTTAIIIGLFFVTVVLTAIVAGSLM